MEIGKISRRRSRSSDHVELIVISRACFAEDGKELWTISYFVGTIYVHFWPRVVLGVAVVRSLLKLPDILNPCDWLNWYNRKAIVWPEAKTFFCFREANFVSATRSLHHNFLVYSRLYHQKHSFPFFSQADKCASVCYGSKIVLISKIRNSF